MLANNMTEMLDFSCIKVLERELLLYGCHLVVVPKLLLRALTCLLSCTLRRPQMKGKLVQKELNLFRSSKELMTYAKDVYLLFYRRRNHM